MGQVCKTELTDVGFDEDVLRRKTPARCASQAGRGVGASSNLSSGDVARRTYESRPEPGVLRRKTTRYCSSQARASMGASVFVFRDKVLSRAYRCRHSHGCISQEDTQDQHEPGRREHWKEPASIATSKEGSPAKVQLLGQRTWSRSKLRPLRMRDEVAAARVYRCRR